MLASKQSGLATLNTNGTVTDVTITSVDLSRAWVVVTARASSFSPQDYVVGYYLSSSTNLKIFTADNDTAVYAEWQVFEFSTTSGITVQRGSFTGSPATVTISAVTVAESHVDISMASGGSTLNDNHCLGASITGTTTVSFYYGNTDSGVTKYWQVVDWNGYASVQHVSQSILSTDTGVKDITISSLTDYTKTMVIGSCTSGGSIQNQDLGTLRCTSATNLRFERQTGVQTLTIYAEVIEFTTSDVTVQQVSDFYGNNSAQETETTTSVDVDNTAIVVGSCLHWYGSADISNDKSTFMSTFDLTNATTITIDRETSAFQNNYYAFSVIEFGTLSGGGVKPRDHAIGAGVNRGIFRGI